MVVVKLLTGPGRIAELREPDHARTALEGVERAAQGGGLRQVVGHLRQPGMRRASLTEHFDGLFQKDGEHLAVIVVAGGGSRSVGAREAE